MDASLLHTASALTDLLPQWEALWRDDPRATPFQSPHWLLPWWEHIGRGTLASVAVRSSGELVGLAPLYVYVDGDGRRHLFPLGMATTDYLDVLARPACAREVAATVLDAVREHAHAWDVFECPQLRADSPLLEAALAAGWRREVFAGEPHPVLPLDQALPRSTAGNVRTARNRAARRGSLVFEQAQTRSLPVLLDGLAKLHARRWGERGLPGVLADPAVLAAHGAAAPRLQAAGLLRLHGLRLDGELVAVLYCLADPPQRPRRRVYYYLGGFDPRHAGLSPGTLLVAHAIEHARAEGAQLFDFLRGAEPYKYRWGAVDQAMATLRLWHGAGRQAATNAPAHPA